MNPGRSHPIGQVPLELNLEREGGYRQAVGGWRERRKRRTGRGELHPGQREQHDHEQKRNGLITGSDKQGNRHICCHEYYYGPLWTVDTFLGGWGGKKSKEYFITYETAWNSNFIFIKFYWNLTMLIHLHIVSVCFYTQCHSWVAATEPTWPATPKTFTIWPFTESLPSPALGDWVLPRGGLGITRSSLAFYFYHAYFVSRRKGLGEGGLVSWQGLLSK